MDWLRVSCETQGFFTRAQARDLGYGDREMARAVRSGEWTRIRRGYYTFGDIWAGMNEVERHRVRAHAVLDSLGPSVALSHVSGALEHGIATWGIPLHRVHVTRLDGASGRIEGDVVHHTGASLDGDLMELNGRRVMVPGRCALETAILGTAESGLVSLDSLLTQGLETPDGLFARFETMERWPSTRHLHIPVRMADPGAQSPGESRGRWLFRQGGLPAPLTQFEVYDDDGRLVGTCDWGWPDDGLLGEFDGASKYGRLLQPGQDPGEVVFAEKHREDALREVTGYRMFRLIWSDYDRPRVTVARIERLLRRTA